MIPKKRSPVEDGIDQQNKTGKEKELIIYFAFPIPQGNQIFTSFSI